MKQQMVISGLVGLIRIGVRHVGQPRPPRPCLGSAHGFGLPLPTPKIVVNLVASDDPQPPAKSVAAALFVKSAHMRRDRLKHLLKHIGDVLGWQIHPPTPMPNEW